MIKITAGSLAFGAPLPSSIMVALVELDGALFVKTNAEAPFIYLKFVNRVSTGELYSLDELKLIREGTKA